MLPVGLLCVAGAALLVSAPAASGATRPLQITTPYTAVPAATIGQPYSFTVQAAGGAEPYSGTISGATPSTGLPPGLTFSNGTISGPALEPEEVNLDVNVKDASTPVRQSNDISFTFIVSTGNATVNSTLALAEGPVQSGALSDITRGLLSELTTPLLSVVNDVLSFCQPFNPLRCL
jgi:hypothetical protein